jgi:XTP/dITP diphosphohydrolase
LYAAAAGLLGAAVAAFYILPAAYEEKWINIAQVLSPGVRPQDNFLFTTISDPDHNRFNRLVSLVAAAELIVLAITASFSRRQHQKQLRLRWVILIWAGGSALLMFSFSVAFWLHLPLLRFIQLPWRWLLCLNVTLVVLTALAWKQWLWRATAILLMLAVLAFVWRRVQPPWWDSVSDIADIVTQHQSGAGYEGTDEYVPAGADPYDVKPDAPFVALNTGGPLQVQVQRWSPETKLFIVEAQQPGKLVLRLFNYPAWQVLVNGHRVEAETQDDTGKMLIPIVAGESAVYVGFVRTWDRRLGGIVSLVSVAGLLLWFARGRFRSEVKRVLIATSNPGKLRDFAGAAAAFGIEVNAIPNFASLPPVLEDGATFEANARKKAEAYSRYVPGEVVLADDSGLEVDALGGAPGVRSARYAAEEPHLANSNTNDAANNARLLRELKNVPSERRGARFVCVIAAARDGHILGVFRGQAEGTILDAPRGQKGFGYDPLFYFASIQKTFAELSAEEKAQYSHRGAAFREFLRWYGSGVKNP